MPSCQHLNLQNKETEVESSLEVLKIQILASMVPPEFAKIKDSLLRLVETIVLGRTNKDDEIVLFTKHIVDRSMNILIFLEAMDDIQHITLERLHQKLGAVQKLVESAIRWKSYPCSVDGLSTVLSIKGRDLERQITSIHDDVKRAFSNPETVALEESLPSKQAYDTPSSTFFSEANNVTIRNSAFYSSAPGGTINLTQKREESNSEHPDFPGLPLCRELKLETQLYKGRLYRLHRGKALGEPVLVKVLRGKSTMKLCRRMFQFCRDIIHSNILRVLSVGAPSRTSTSPYLVFDGDYRGTVESQLTTALKRGIRDGCIVGYNTVIACSLGLSYLQESGLSFQNLGPEHFVLMLSKQGTIVLYFDADLEWPTVSSDDVNQSEVNQNNVNKATEICNGLIQRIFSTSSKGHYIDPAPYFEDTEEIDQSRFEEIPGCDGSFDGCVQTLTQQNSQQYSSRTIDNHRRELVWKPKLPTSDSSLEEMGQIYQAYLASIQMEHDLPALRRSHSRSVHRCVGYNRTEIILTPLTERNVIVSHSSLIPSEICSICGEKADVGEVFDCLCGFPEDAADHQPTIKCSVCSRWQHQLCMKITPEMHPIKRFVCWRCPGTRITIDSFGTTSPSSTPESPVPIIPRTIEPSISAPVAVGPTTYLPTPTMTPIPSPPLSPPPSPPLSPPPLPPALLLEEPPVPGKNHPPPDFPSVVFDVINKVKDEVEREIGREVVHELAHKIRVDAERELRRGLEQEAERFLKPLGQPGKILQKAFWDIVTGRG